MKFRLRIARYLYRIWRWVDPLTEVERIALDAQIYGTGVRRNMPNPGPCPSCRKRPALDLANISQEYKRDLSDWEWLCRKCHMTKDGRINNLRRNAPTSL